MANMHAFASISLFILFLCTNNVVHKEQINNFNKIRMLHAWYVIFGSSLHNCELLINSSLSKSMDEN